MFAHLFSAGSSFEFREQLVDVMKDRVKCRELVRTVEREQQQHVYHTIFDRRVLHALSYFDMPRRATVRRIQLLNEDDSVLDAFMALGKLRRPPIIWTPPRPQLPKGCIRFGWHQFRTFQRPKLTPAQLFAIQRDRAILQEVLRARQRKRESREFFSKGEPEIQRTMTTRCGRTATALPSYLFCEVEEEDPAQSGT